MANISPSELALEVLNHCLRGTRWPDDLLMALTDAALDPDEDLAASASRALFSVVVERLGDLFEPALCDTYAELFSQVIARALPGLRAPELCRRYKEVRLTRPVEGDPRNVFVLSRVTLGADVAVTSIILDGARRRFPTSEIWFVGPRKSYELFERSIRIRHLPVQYGRRGTLGGRLEVFEPLREALSASDSLVLDPDSRLTQLGLLPVCAAGRHHLFESRSYGGLSLDPLPKLTKEWVRATLGVEDAEPWLHPKFSYDFGDQPLTTVSFGVGENPAKRVPDPFEEDLLRLLATRDGVVMVDAGAQGSEEEMRVKRAIARSGVQSGRVGTHEGSFASFAAMIAASQLYAGYDSAGQHVAAALGVPLISVFTGFVSPRMLARWSPDGPGPKTVLDSKSVSSGAEVGELLEQVRSALAA